MKRLIPILLFQVSMILIGLSSHAQISITYGGLNPSEMPALEGSEYLAKVNDNMLFTGSATQNAIALLSFDELNETQPFSLVQNWTGSIDGVSLGSVKDLHYDNVISKLFIVQQAPSKIIIFSFDEQTHSLTFDSETALTGMVTPERFAKTDDLLIVVDMLERKAADLIYDGVSAPVFLTLHNLTSCGLTGSYKDVELAPNQDYLYVTSFNQASVVKISLTPSGMNCDGIIDFGDLLGTALMGDLTFISEDRAFVTSCIGPGGVVRMTSNGDFDEPVPGSIALFDAMKTIYIPADSLLVIQSVSTTGGGTFKLNADYSFDQVPGVLGVANYNKELIEMANGNVIHMDDLYGSLSVLVKGENSAYEEISRTFAGGAVVFPEARAFFDIVINESDEYLYGFGTNGIQKFQINVDGELTYVQAFSGFDFTSAQQIVFIDDQHFLVFSNDDGTAKSLEIDGVTGVITVLSELSNFSVGFGSNWNFIYDEIGNTLLMVPNFGGEVYQIQIQSNFMLSEPTAIQLPGSIAGGHALISEISPSSNLVVIIAEDQCVETLVQLERVGQEWSVASTEELSSIGSSQCPIKAITFMGTDDKLCMMTENAVFNLDLNAQTPIVNYYQFLPTDDVLTVRDIGYNQQVNRLFMVGFSESNYTSRLSMFDVDATTLYVGSIVESISDEEQGIHGMSDLRSVSVSNNGSFIYALDQNSHLIHTFGVEDETLVSTINNDSKLFSAYPNPANSELTLQFSNAFKGVLNLYDNTGKKVLSQSINNEESQKIDLHVFPSGIYHLQLNSDTGELTSEKLIITK